MQASVLDAGFSPVAEIDDLLTQSRLASSRISMEEVSATISLAREPSTSSEIYYPRRCGNTYSRSDLALIASLLQVPYLALHTI